MNFFFKNLSHQIYFGIFILCLLLGSLFYLPYFLFLHGVGEYKSIQDIVSKQLSSSKNVKVIYGSAIRAMNYYYKKELMQKINPEIVAWGSSRVMQFRQKMFLAKFVNLGGIFNSIDAGLISYKDILNAKPKIVLLGIDFWWFNENFQKENYKEVIAPQHYKPKSSDLKLVKEWLSNGKISYHDLLKGAFSLSGTGIGVAGALERDGFGPDGSYYYTGIISGVKKHHDIQFSDTLMRIKKGERRFEYGAKISEKHFNDFKQIVNELRQNKIEVILFFPPLSSIANKAMKKRKIQYAYIEQLKKLLISEGYSFYDYSDSMVVGSDDCEFIDGFHGGDVTYSRILNDLLTKRASLTQYINVDFLNKNIERYKGYAFIPDNSVKAKEVDFIQLGCKKA